MGFHVWLRGDDAHFVRQLRTDPSEIFGRPYAGYLLFLVGGADTAALEWLKKHLVPLDSLTGDHVAYALFAARVPLRLTVSAGAARQGRTLGDVSLFDVQRIESFAKSGRLGWLADGDQVNAVTYGTDQVARAFGVVRHLPCVVVLDALASDEVDVIELDDAALELLLPILRETVHELTQDVQFAPFIATLEMLSRIEDDVARFQRATDEQRSKLARLPVGGDDETLRPIYERARNALVRGSVRDYRRAVAMLEHHFGKRVDTPATSEIADAVIGYARTIYSLNEYRNSPWPLIGDQSERCRRVINNHALRLLRDETSALPLTRDNVDYYQQALMQRQSQFIDSVLAQLPTTAVIAQAIADSRIAEAREIEREIRRLNDELERLQDRGRQVLSVCLSEDAPSLRKTLRKIGREKKLKLTMASVVDKAAAYAGKALEPSNLARVFGAIAGA